MEQLTCGIIIGDTWDGMSYLDQLGCLRLQVFNSIVWMVNSFFFWDGSDDDGEGDEGDDVVVGSS